MQVKSEFVSSHIILSDVLVNVDDESYRKGLTRGWYISSIQRALEKLSMTTFFDEQEPMDLPMPKNLIWKLPDNFFNIQQLYVFNGACCTVGGSANVYFKRNFNNKPNGQGYTALNKADQQNFPDPYFWNFNYSVADISDPNNQLFANIQNGFLMFSTGCKGWENFRVIYNGFGGVIGKEPLVPRPLREVVIDLVTLNVCAALMAKNPRSAYGALYNTYYEKLYNKSNGTYHDAERFVAMSDNWIKNCREIYEGNLGNW